MGTCSTPPYGVQGFWQPKCWGTKGNEGVVVSWRRPENYSNTSVTHETLDFSLQMSHCHSVCLCPANNLPPRKITDQMWVCTFGAISDSPFVLASVWSPASPPFPLAHCELQRTRGWVLRRQFRHMQIEKMFGNHWKGNTHTHTICIIWLITLPLNWVSFLIS